MTIRFQFQISILENISCVGSYSEVASTQNNIQEEFTKALSIPGNELANFPVALKFKAS